MAKFIELTAEDERIGKFLVNVDHIVTVHKAIFNGGGMLKFAKESIVECAEPYHEIKAKIREAVSEGK